MKLLKNNKAQGLVEFALILPLLVFLLFGMIDVGLALNKQYIFNQMTKELARATSVGKESTELQTLTTDYIKMFSPIETLDVLEESLADGSPISKFIITTNAGERITITFQPSITNRIKGNTLLVTSEYNYIPITPFLESIASIPIHTSTYTRIEVSSP